MKFDLAKAIEILQRTPSVLRSLLVEVSDDWIYHNEGENTWSVFDVVGHLIVCEKTGFMPRIAIVLSNHPDKIFAPIDMYAHFEWNKGKTISDLLHEFELLRASNIEHLNALELTAAAFQKTGQHAKIGPTTLSELLATWAAHDLSHIAQMSRVMAKQLKEEVGPFISFLTILK